MGRVTIYASVLIVVAINLIAADREDWDDRERRGEREGWERPGERDDRERRGELDDRERRGEREGWERPGERDDRERRGGGRVMDTIESMCRRHDVEFEELRDFCEAEAPEILEAIESAINGEGEEAIKTVMEAVERYVEYRELSAHDPQLANRWLNYHRGEYRSWQLGDAIRDRREQARHAGTLARVEPELRKLEEKLRRLLVELFEQKQALQQHEVRQMKAELVEMTTIIKKRAAKREQILERRFAELSGNEEDLEW
ncbi:MAG: hypothetical protein QF541_15250 [Lentisphaeria bacterium]|jgi:hypothetical protein|nr:hypothetical protein [Lentisphaeria bacterium]